MFDVGSLNSQCQAPAIIRNDPTCILNDLSIITARDLKTPTPLPLIIMGIAGQHQVFLCLKDYTWRVSAKGLLSTTWEETTLLKGFIVEMPSRTGWHSQNRSGNASNPTWATWMPLNSWRRLGKILSNSINCWPPTTLNLIIHVKGSRPNCQLLLRSITFMLRRWGIFLTNYSLFPDVQREVQVEISTRQRQTTWIWRLSRQSLMNMRKGIWSYFKSFNLKGRKRRGWRNCAKNKITRWKTALMATMTISIDRLWRALSQEPHELILFIWSKMPVWIVSRPRYQRTPRSRMIVNGLANGQSRYPRTLTLLLKLHTQTRGRKPKRPMLEADALEQEAKVARTSEALEPEGMSHRLKCRRR